MALIIPHQIMQAQFFTLQSQSHNAGSENSNEPSQFTHRFQLLMNLSSVASSRWLQELHYGGQNGGSRKSDFREFCALKKALSIVENRIAGQFRQFLVIPSSKSIDPDENDACWGVSKVGCSKISVPAERNLKKASQTKLIAAPTTRVANLQLGWFTSTGNKFWCLFFASMQETVVNYVLWAVRHVLGGTYGAFGKKTLTSRGKVR